MTPLSGSRRSELSALDPVGKRDVYALGARIFATEIDAVLLHQLAAPQLAGAGLTLLDDEIRTLDEQSALDELAAEYCRLFIGPKQPCSPYASVQRGEATLGGRAATRILEFLERHGLAVGETNGMAIASPDHIAVILSVLATLYGELAMDPDNQAASSAARELVKSALTWVPDFLETVVTSARREPYQSISKLLRALLEEEREQLSHGS